MRPHPEDPGLQPQRSALAWSRTTIAAVINGVLILTHDLRDVAVLIPGVLAIAIATATLAIGCSRRAVLSQRPLPAPLAAPTAVHLVGWSVVALCVSTLMLLVLPG